MAGIIEIWRKAGVAHLPVRFTVGDVPRLMDGTALTDAPTIKSISYRESGAIAGKRFSEPVFCISFEDSNVQRFIPASSIADIAYESKKDPEITAPALEE